MKLVTFCIFCVVSLVSGKFRVDPLVLIEQGLVRGLRSSDGSYSSFLGIPYASVDLKNPFGPAQPHSGFGENVYNAYYGLVRCPQSISIVAGESQRADEILDCLHLNVYAPTLANSQNLSPVLVWIHGGDFSVGYGGQYGPEKLVKQGIIVVTINYRLGPYGFMCLDVPAVPGNQGLKDQYEALRWIRNNIKAFGGDPASITIAGQGAGASSTLFHLYSDEEKLFSKVIAESGTPQNIGTLVDGDVNAAWKLASHLGFNTTDTEEALQFLSQTSYALVTAAAVELGLELKPCREKSFSGINNFIENYPQSLSNEIKVHNTPILIGHTSKENLNLLSTINNNYFNSDPFFDRISSNFNLDEDQLNQAVKIVRRFYIGDKAVSASVQNELENFESDIVYNHPIQRTITQLLNENASPIYAYEFSYVENDEDEAANSDELKYLFQMWNSKTKINNENRIIGDRLTTMWANFVKYGNPTPEQSELLSVLWTPVTQDTRPYLVIDSNLSLEHRIYQERMAFWDLFYLTYGKFNKFLRECAQFK